MDRDSTVSQGQPADGGIVRVVPDPTLGGSIAAVHRAVDAAVQSSMALSRALQDAAKVNGDDTFAEHAARAFRRRAHDYFCAEAAISQALFDVDKALANRLHWCAGPCGTEAAPLRPDMAAYLCDLCYAKAEAQADHEDECAAVERISLSHGWH